MDLYNSLLMGVCAFTIIWYINHWWVNRPLYLKSKNIHGPLALPIIGMAFYLFFQKPSEYIKILNGFSKKFPRIIKLWLGPRLAFVVTDPIYIAKIFNHPHAVEKPHDFYVVLKDCFGDSLMVSDGALWKVHRKALQPSFNQNILNSYVSIFEKNSTRLVGYIREVIGKKDVDWLIFAQRYTLQTACETMLGVDMNILHNGPRNDDFGECLDKLNRLGAKRALNVWYFIDIIYKFSNLKKELDETLNKINNHVTLIVERKKKEFEENKEMIMAEIEGNRRLNLLDNLLLHSTFTDKQVLNQVKIFLSAATDTTAATLCSTFIILAMYPDVQQKVYEEITNVVGSNREIEVSDLPNLKYVEQVIKEVLRILPSGLIFGRYSTEDINLGDVIIPKDTTIGFVPYLIHRNPKYWKDPLTFNPDRFSAEQINTNILGSYLPFALGPRNCIGWQFALLNVKTVISSVIREFKVLTSYKSVEEIECALEAVMNFTNGVNIWFEPREK